MPREFVFGGREAADIADAERSILDLDHESAALADTEALARLLLRAESVASSHIEGLEIGARRLLRADAARASGGEEMDVTAAEVLGNIDAMTYSLAAVDRERKITVALLLKVHRRLFSATRGQQAPGHVRTAQNWIGGSSYNPCSAKFVPPPPELVEHLMLDLCDFANDDSLSPVAQAAIAHAQFETIHPFTDGNGRVGRALIHMVLRRRGLTRRISLPVSLVLATRSDDYVEGLGATRYVGPPDSSKAMAGVNQWVGTFAAACSRAAQDASRFEKRIRRIQERWRDRIGRVRADAAVLRLIDVLPGAPIITAEAASKMIQRSLPAALNAIETLVHVRVLEALHADRKRKQVYEAREVINAFMALERQLTSPAGDTRIAGPNRAAPRRVSGRRP